MLAALGHLEGRFPRRLMVEEVRRVLQQMREELRAGTAPAPTPVEMRVERNLAKLEAPSLRRVINATGVVLHTNLGRAPLAPFEPLFGYSNLEYDLRAGRRGKRDVHASELIERLTGAPGIAVNNNAAAIYLALNELAAGFEVIVSRGELIEIGDGFRIPEIMQRSGAVLREVGTTNRTHIDDYRDAINERTRLLLRVHPSNFRIQGFTARPELGELAALAKQRGIPLYEDLGSGCVTDLRAFGVEEPAGCRQHSSGCESGVVQRRQAPGRTASGNPRRRPGTGRAPPPQSHVSGAAPRQDDLPGARNHAAQSCFGTLGSDSVAAHDRAIERGVAGAGRALV